jgi:hypothetical protein
MLLFDVSPRKAILDVLNCRGADAKVASNRSASFATQAFANIRNIGFRQLRGSKVAPPSSPRLRHDGRVLSPLSVGVYAVVLSGPEPQMVWSYAWRVVAAVENRHPSRNWAIVHFPGNTMSALLHSIKTLHAVAARQPSAAPFPAARLLFANLLPKPVFGSPAFCHIRSLPRHNLTAAGITTCDIYVAL